MHVLGHDHVPDEQEIKFVACFIQQLQKQIAGAHRLQIPPPVITTESNEMQVALPVQTLQILWHGKKPKSGPPLKTARVGHPGVPSTLYCIGKCSYSIAECHRATQFDHSHQRKGCPTRPDTRPMLPNTLGAWTTEGAGANATIFYNANSGSVFNSPFNVQPSGVTVYPQSQLGGFNGGSVQGQALMLLHELAHTLLLLPPDGPGTENMGFPPSSANTAMIAKNCAKAIQSASNPH